MNEVDPLHVYYATMTGNAEDLASRLSDRAGRRGMARRVIDLSEVSPERLLEDAFAVFIVSTWGDGEPPDDAEDFWEALRGARLALSRMNYAVFGLGDSGYDDFNAFGRMLDERLADLGASRLLRRVEADVDFEDDFERWSERVLELALRGRSESARP